jgi:hypothetical protein
MFCWGFTAVRVCLYAVSGVQAGAVVKRLLRRSALGLSVGMFLCRGSCPGLSGCRRFVVVPSLGAAVWVCCDIEFRERCLLLMRLLMFLLW